MFKIFFKNTWFVPTEMQLLMCDHFHQCVFPTWPGEGIVKATAMAHAVHLEIASEMFRRNKIISSGKVKKKWRKFLGKFSIFVEPCTGADPSLNWEIELPAIGPLYGKKTKSPDALVDWEALGHGYRSERCSALAGPND